MAIHTSDEIVHDPIGKYPVATVACFDAVCGELPRRKLDSVRTTAFLEKLARLGAPAVLIAASTGQGHVRTVEELREWFQVAARANLGRTVRMALLRPEDGLAANESLLDDLARLDYPIVFVRPGNNLPATASDREIAANVAELVAAAARRRLAVGVYSIPDVSGVRLSAQAAALVLDGPGGDRVVAAKITEADYSLSTRQYLEHPALRRLKIVQGWDPHLAQALQDGPKFDDWGRQRCGITSGPMSFAVYQYLHILDQLDRGAWDEVRAAQTAVTALFQSMQDDPTKFAAVQRAKYVMGLGQPLLDSVSDEQAERILAALESLPRRADQLRLALSLNLMKDGPFSSRLTRLALGDSQTPLVELKQSVREFVDSRDWRRFHAPKVGSPGTELEFAL